MPGLKQMSVGRSDMYTVKYSDLIEGDNIRVDYGDLDVLAKQLSEMGQLKPLEVKVPNEKSEIEIVDGHRRFRAMKIAEEKYGVDFSRVKCVPELKGTSEPTRIIDMMISNDSKPLNAIEQADAFRRLLGYNLTEAEIARKIGRSVQYVNDILAINEADSSVVDAISEKRMSTSAARSIAKAPKATQRKIVKESEGKIKVSDVQKETKGRSSVVSGRGLECNLKTARIKRDSSPQDERLYWDGVVFGCRAALGLETI